MAFEHIPDCLKIMSRMVRPMHWYRISDIDLSEPVMAKICDIMRYSLTLSWHIDTGWCTHMSEG